MNAPVRSLRLIPSLASLIALAVLACRPAAAQQTSTPADASTATANGCAPLNWTAEQDHRNMMDQLGIKAAPSRAERQREGPRSRQLR